MKTFEEFLAESRPGSHAILPASRILYGKNKVTPDHAASTEMKDADHITVETHRDGMKHFHVSSYGNISSHDVGSYHAFHHDQTGAHMAHSVMVGKAHYSHGKLTHVEGEDHTKNAYPIHVYK